MSRDDQLPKMIAPDETDPRIRSAVAELKQAIRQRFPSAEFSVTSRDDPEPGIYLKATVDVDDLDEVTDPVVPRLVDMQVEEGLPVYVVAAWPDARIAAYVRREKTSWLSGPMPFLEP